VLAALAGPAGVGLANMARIFISPFSFLLPAVNKIAMPRLAELRATDPARTRRLSRRLTAALTTLALAYGIGLSVLFEPAQALLLGRAVPGIVPLVALWCTILVFQVLRSGGSVLLQIEQRFRALSLLNLPSAAVALAATMPLAWLYGAPGALLGLLAGELVLTYLIWKEIRHVSLPSTAAHN
jgi:O-antigen/teichoic acid export membrane protein